LTRTGVAYCWGHNDQGELGNGEFNASQTPVAVAGGLAFRQVTTGDALTCGVTTGGVAYCWGNNIEGQLGIGNDTGPQVCFSAESLHGCSNHPVRVARRLSFSRLSAGFRHVCGVATDGSGFCWGSPEALGREDVTGLRPVQVAGRLTFAGVSAGTSHSYGVTTDHVAYCWGRTGALGIGGMRERACPDHVCSRPQRVDTDLTFLDVQAGPGHTCGVTTSNVAYCWGGNSSGELGDGTTHSRLRPRRVANPG
jgi:alpha-tubulin suppressor-like RCC1 family protein